VSYTVLPQAISPHDHLQQAYRLSAGSQYFKWTFPGELLPTTFIQHCVRALDQQPTAVLAFAPAGSITQQQPPQDRDRAAISVNSHSPEQRFAAVALADHGPLCPSELCGLYRRAALELIPPPASHPAAERVFLARLALVGRFVQVPEVLLPRHHHVPSVVPPRLEYSTQIDFPEWRLMLEYLRSIQYGWLNLHQRAACAAIVLHRQVIDGNWVRLGRDVALAGQKLLSRLIRKPGPDLAATTATSAAIAPPVLSSTLPAAARSVPKAA
jgi:hypothetical protein